MLFDDPSVCVRSAPRTAKGEWNYPEGERVYPIDAYKQKYCTAGLLLFVSG